MREVVVFGTIDRVTCGGSYLRMQDTLPEPSAAADGCRLSPTFPGSWMSLGDH